MKIATEKLRLQSGELKSSGNERDGKTITRAPNRRRFGHSLSHHLGLIAWAEPLFASMTAPQSSHSALIMFVVNNRGPEPEEILRGRVKHRVAFPTFRSIPRPGSLAMPKVWRTGDNLQLDGLRGHFWLAPAGRCWLRIVIQR